jgi:hypothetical protein
VNFSLQQQLKSLPSSFTMFCRIISYAFLLVVTILWCNRVYNRVSIIDCKQCVFIQCPLVKVMLSCERDLVLDASDILNLYPDETEIFKALLTVQLYGERMDTCITDARYECRNDYCTGHCTSSNISYEISKMTPLYLWDNISQLSKIDECVYNNINFSDMYRFCYSSRDKEQCVLKQIKQAETYCLKE